MQVTAPKRIVANRGVAIGALLVAVSFVCGYAFAGGGNAQVGSGEMVSLMVDYGDGTIDTYPNLAPTAHETLFALTKRVAEAHDIAFAYKDYANLGSFVSQIGPARELPSDVYWQYWVNNVYAQVGSDAYEVQPGDVIVWKLTKSKQ